MNGLPAYVEGLAAAARRASIQLRTLSAEAKNRALQAIADRVRERSAAILAANADDLARGRARGLPSAMLDRLALDERRVAGLRTSLAEIAAFEDPVGETTGVRRPAGFTLQKVRTPIGVVLFIYESRPNVTVDAAALCLKSGNAVILRGGSEARESNRALAAAIREGIAASGVPADAVQIVERPEHEAIDLLVGREGLIDLVIPRGGEALIRRVTEQSRVPVIKHYKGVCHLYVDASADLEMAVKVVVNSKVQRPGVCNALEKLLVHADVAPKFLPALAAAMPQVELRGCPRTAAILPGIRAASETDWDEEYLDLILAVRVVDTADEACEHIERHGSRHTDGILAADAAAIERFVAAVDSAAVTVNASTRLNDGGVFGLGAEIGISTDKLHARGPMGLRELTTYKWVVRGSGDLRTEPRPPGA
jgi:glutamate-5-semialdehyde dehydrogenase